jgi:beta-lactamase class A
MSNTVITRRLFVVSAALAPACARARAQADPVAQLAAVEARLGGRLGVSAACGCASESIGYRAHEPFAMCSTFKAPLAGCVLARVDGGLASLDERLSFGAADLLDHAPVTRARVAEGALSVRDLCAAIVEVSDNTAANLLLRLVGGPAAFTTYLRSLGDAHTRLDRYEPSLNTNLPDDPRDTTTPDAMRVTMSKLLFGDQILSPASRAMFASWLVNCRTGLERLRAGLPAGWRVGDKTGTGANGAANDVACAWPPQHPPLVIASYVSAPDATPAARNAAHAEVARIVAHALTS